MTKHEETRGRLLILFCRNAELGKVKTRLAVNLGDDKALAVYYLLCHHTKEISLPLTCDKMLCYSDFIDTEDNWPSEIFNKSLQKGADLGEKMMNAFREGFDRKYKSICIIGMDCFELTSQMVELAFEKLRTHEAVIGPAKDGGYYLLGMNSLYVEVFRNKSWSTDTICANTLADFKRLKLNVLLLDMLTDVDVENDLPASIRKLL